MIVDRNRLRLLRDAAREIADGKPVDWRRMTESHDDLADSLDGLRLVEAVAEVHRSPLPEEQPFEKTGPPDSFPLRPVEAADGSPGPGTWGRLQVGPLLGKGSYGEVHRAHDPALRKDVALKLIRSELGARDGAEERFLQEARRLARVAHENVVVVHGADRHDGRVGIWTELIEGSTLEDHLQMHGNLNASEAAVVGQHLCRALAAVHGAGLVHRDVKTHNIMRRRADGQILLMDFSAAARRAPWGGEPAIGRGIEGTPPYLAPEVLRGEEAGVAADIYSLGVVLYRLVTGRFPIEARTVKELRDRHRREEAVSLMDRRPDLDPAFIQIVEKAMDRDPARRYASMGEMERDLARVLILPAAAPAARPWWRHASTWIATAAVAVAALLWLSLVPPASGPLRMTVDLVRLAGSGYERLPAGAAVYAGEFLSLEIQGSEAIHVYALSVDPSGEAIALFPDGTIENPLEGGMVHRLPGVENGEPTYWKVSGQRGVESFYVFASPKPLPEAARLIARSLAVSSPPPPGASSDAERSRPRGIAGRASPGTAARPPRDEESARLLKSLLEMSGNDRKVRAWQIAVENHG